MQTDLKKIFQSPKIIVYLSIKKEYKMQETIIETAGKIWEYLNENGEVTTKKMNKDLGLNENFASLGLGWLAREDKVNFSKRGSYTKVSLR